MSGLIAFHELVTIKSWADSSTRGPSIKVGLPSRDALAVFEKITRRAGKRAGQRYKAVWQDEGTLPPHSMDLWFAGANWSHQDGASVKFSVHPDDLDIFQDGRLQLERDDKPLPYWLTLVQVDDDEKPIDQQKAEVMEQLKGGPKSKRVAMLCQQADFQQYVAYRVELMGGEPVSITFDEADTWVKDQVGVASKVEFDHNADAWTMFEARVMSPFIRWGQSQSWRDDDEEADGDS